MLTYFRPRTESDSLTIREGSRANGEHLWNQPPKPPAQAASYGKFR
jgi:hypothetical protein